MRLRKSRRTAEYLRPLGLNERQRQALAAVEASGELSARRYQEVFRVSYRTAARDLAGLVRAGLLHRDKGKPRFTTGGLTPEDARAGQVGRILAGSWQEGQDPARASRAPPGTGASVRIPTVRGLPAGLEHFPLTWTHYTLPTAYSEKELEEALMREVEKLLLELGPDFALLARQQKLVIDGQLHFIDLLFYHRGLPCLVLVDLKVVPFESAFVGDMNKYLNGFRENYRYAWERDPIGLIICRYAGKEEVHYATGRLENRIFVAE